MRTDGESIQEEPSNFETGEDKEEEDKEDVQLDTLAENTAKMKAELHKERKILERTRGNWKKDCIKWVKEQLEATQLQENIIPVIATFT